MAEGARSPASSDAVEEGVLQELARVRALCYRTDAEGNELCKLLAGYLLQRSWPNALPHTKLVSTVFR